MMSPALKFISPLAGIIAASLLIPLRADLLVKPHDVIAVGIECQAAPRSAAIDIAEYLLMCQPVEDVRVVQCSQRFDGVESFMKRVDTDIAPWHPTVALIAHSTGEGHSDPQSRGFTYYHPTYLGMTLDELKKIGVRTIVVGSPGCVDSATNPDDAKICNTNLAALRDADRDLAAKHNAVFADLYSPMFDAMTKSKAALGDTYLLTLPATTFPDANGQLTAAYGFLKALGCDGAIGTITVDLAANKAEGTPGQKILSCKDGAVEVESSRYPFCFAGDPTKPQSTSGIINYFPFNDDLNRYLLIVKGLTGTKAKVTWGSQSREFPVADLEKGINLAAVFAAHTPFDETFQKVERALWIQQEPEALFTENFFHPLAGYRTMAPNAGASIDQVIAAIMAQDKQRAADAAALVVPVHHTIKIEVIP
jgi:hypothetical protein